MRSDYQPFQIRPRKEDVELDEDVSVCDEEKTKKNTSVLGFIRTKLDELIFSNVPYDKIKEYPPNFMFYTGSFLLFIIGIFFCANFVYLFTTNIGTVFLSPTNGGDSTSNCISIPSSNTGTFFATHNGTWAGDDDFSYSEATYLLTLTSLEVTQNQYDHSMSMIYGSLNGIGTSGEKHDLAYNLMTWFSFTALPNEAIQANRLNLIGDPAYTFNRQNIYGAISSVAGDCNLDGQSASIDVANGDLMLTIPADKYKNDSICSQMGDLSLLGFDSYAKDDEFQLKIDIRSLVTAIAVNYNILQLKHLSEIKLYREETDDFTFSRYYDPIYPGMTPIYCFQTKKGDNSSVICSLNLQNGTVILPFFHHSGHDDNHPLSCDCDTLTVDELADPNHDCNMFRFMVGFLYFPSVTESLQLAFQLYFQQGESYQNIHSKTFGPAWLGSVFGMSSNEYAGFYNTPAEREKLYSFCSLQPLAGLTTAPSNCSMVIFSLSDSTADWTISEYYYQLTNGACRNTIGTSWNNW
jgi:hypothetical protein